MAIQIVMDHNGDTRHYFDPNDVDALAKAEERFKEPYGPRLYCRRSDYLWRGCQNQFVQFNRPGNGVFPATYRWLTGSS